MKRDNIVVGVNLKPLVSIQTDIIERLVRALEDAADWAPGYCWCDGSKRHSRACLRARKAQEEAREFLERPERSRSRGKG